MLLRLIATLVLVALIVGSLLFSRGTRETLEAQPDGERSADTGYSARNAEIIETGEDGRPLYTVSAEVIRQYPAVDSVDLQQVRMNYRDTNDNHWTVRADRGVLRRRATQIDLLGGVRVAGKLPGERQPAEIRTEELSFDTETEIVATDEPVTLFWSGHTLRAVGLVVNLKDQQLQLESEVHGRFSR